MKIVMNKEIQNFKETLFWGLTFRQSFFSILGCGAAVVLYFWLKPYFGLETLSWICMMGAAPFAALGFIRYNGMYAEQLFAACFRYLLTPKKLVFRSENRFYELMKPYLKKKQKEEMKEYDADTGKNHKRR